MRSRVCAPTGFELQVPDSAGITKNRHSPQGRGVASATWKRVASPVRCGYAHGGNP
jgi:hypothetical protein